MHLGELYKTRKGFKGTLGSVPVLVREGGRETGAFRIELDARNVTKNAARQFTFFPLFSLAVSSAVYEDGLREKLLAAKIHKNPENLSAFAGMLAATWRSNPVLAGTDAIVPCPHSADTVPALTKTLSLELGRRIKKPVCDVLARRRAFEFIQAALGPAERLENVKGFFTITNPEPVKGKTCLLVDDVITTGATANECAGVLLAAGANKVYVLTLARTPKRGNAWGYF